MVVGLLVAGGNMLSAKGLMALLLVGGMGLLSSAQGYYAHYLILPLHGERPMGHYQLTLQDDYRRQSVQIDYQWRAWFIHHHYRYQDKVQLLANGGMAYRIREDKDGYVTTVIGQQAEGTSPLKLTINNSAGSKTQFRSASSFDNTFFAWRQPRACPNKGQRLSQPMRVLWPINGTVSQLVLNYLPLTKQPLPVAFNGLAAGCLVVLTDEQGKLQQRAWLTPQGDLLYQESHDYRLQLVEQGSDLRHKEAP